MPETLIKTEVLQGFDQKEGFRALLNEVERNWDIAVPLSPLINAKRRPKGRLFSLTER